MPTFQCDYAPGDTFKTDSGQDVKVLSVRFGTDGKPNYELEYPVSIVNGTIKYSNTNRPVSVLKMDVEVFQDAIKDIPPDVVAAAEVVP